MAVRFDSEVVLSEDLVPLIKPEMDRMQRRFEQENSSARNGSQSVMGPLAYISEQAGLDPRAVYRILTGESSFVDLDVADRLCLAVGKFVELELDDDCFYLKRDALKAAVEQTTFLRYIARSKGVFVPTEKKARRAWPAQYRRRILKEAQAA